MIVRIVLLAALVGAAAISLAGTLAPIYPPADFLNHFRPYTFAATSALLLATLALGTRLTTWGSAALTGLNAALLALPLWWSAEPADRPSAGQALASAGVRDLKSVTFNMAYGDAAAVAAFLLQEDADIAVLQEVGGRQLAVLRTLLGHRYPHAHFCVARGCAAAIFAKRPWVAAGQEHSSAQTPEAIWVEFNDADIGRLRVVGVHLHLPYRAETQTRQIDWLIAQRATFTAPAIVAGDFNMTPWSYRLQRLLASASLRRHATFLRSWPTDRYRSCGCPRRPS